MINILLAVLLVGCASGDDWADECVYAHNEARDLHMDTNPVTWSASLAQEAQTYMDSVVGSGSVPHSCPSGTNCGYGENIYMMGGFDGTTQPPCANAVFAWYRETVQYKYDYTAPYYYQATGVNAGHFTQVVWKDSTEVGCGVGVAPGPGWYILCRYKSPGNFRIMGDGMRERALAQVGEPQDGYEAPENPADLMEDCRDMYSMYCPYFASQCNDVWGIDFGPAILCPVTCNKC